MQFKHNGKWNTNVSYVPSQPMATHSIAGGLNKLLGAKDTDKSVTSLPQLGIRDTIWVETETKRKADINKKCQWLVMRVYGFTATNIQYA